MFIPNQLKRGDTIAIIAPAGPVNIEKLQKGYAFFEKMGLKIKLGQHINKVHGYLAGKDEERLYDLHEMMKDPTVKGIFFARGGYGTARLAKSIDYALLRKNPKIIWGYSDITYLHTAIRQEANLITFHGPMVESEIGSEHFDALSARMFKQLFSPTILHYDERIAPLKVISSGASGMATGRLVGGNLSLIISTLGTPFELNVKNKILLLEDVNEQVYKIDSMLHQLKCSGKLQEATAIMIGDFTIKDSNEHPSLTVDDVFCHYFKDSPIPIMSGFKIGHCLPHFSIPLGVPAKMMTAQKTVVIEPGVKIA